MHLPGESRTIALLLDVDFDVSLRIWEGVRGYACREPQWRLLPLRRAQEALLEHLLRQHVLSGVIGAFWSDRWLEGLPGPPVPMVNVSDQSAIRRTPSVVTDNRQVGRLAARHLVQQGYAHFTVLHEPASYAARERRQGFLDALAGMRRVCVPPPAACGASDAGWTEWLADLPRPCGLFCTSDFLARRLLPHIAACSAEVPRDFGLVGVGNDPLDNLLARVPLTSIELDGFRIGEQAAACLAGRMAAPACAGPACPAIPPRQLVPRTSSLRASGGDPVVDRAMACQSLAKPMTGALLAHVCGASRRTLENRFRKAMGCGPATVLRRRRLAHAALLLSGTSLTLAAVAEATGYASAAAFSAAFRQAYGRAPGAWRRAQPDDHVPGKTNGSMFPGKSSTKSPDRVKGTLSLSTRPATPRGS